MLDNKHEKLAKGFNLQSYTLIRLAKTPFLSSFPLWLGENH